jgi:hypothetical protein
VPEFEEGEKERSRRKMELAPYPEEATKRKRSLPPLRDEQIPECRACGRSIAGAMPSVSDRSTAK